ncbi:FSH1-domain-containing protein [Neoconidiobolus thromboides FSU 785]|nr:FSH1-domain-containing protein [Neoconidiobolus thromboides FSU 785]
MSKLRLLMLHGYTQNKNVFEKKCGALRKSLKNHCEFQFIDAPFELTDKEEIKKYSGNSIGDENEKQLAWFIRNSNVYDGLDESVDYLLKFINENGPFDGILGFSQGGIMASIISKMIEEDIEEIKQKYNSINLFKFNIIVSGFLPRDERVLDYYKKNSTIPSLFIIGERDDLVLPANSLKLKERYDNATLLTHEGGHFIPTKAIYKAEILKFVNLHVDFNEPGDKNGLQVKL